MPRLRHTALNAVATVLLASLVAAMGCRQLLIPNIDAPDEGAQATWQVVLHDIVSADGYVNYDALQRRRKPLNRYIRYLATNQAWGNARPTERISDWVNAYNALVMYQIMERDRPKSVMDVTGWLPVPGAAFFVETEFQLNKTRMSLSEIEHERVRLSHMDYRVHAVLNCGSMSCPPMRRDLYTHRGFALQLREQMTRWMDDPRGFEIDGDQIMFNPIFDWYARDFHFWSAGKDVCEIASTYVTGRRGRRLQVATEQGCPHGFFEYDWSLNDISNR
jgi:hypothetical protein